MKDKILAVILASNTKVRPEPKDPATDSAYVVDLHTSRLSHVADQGYKLISVDNGIAYFEFVGKSGESRA